MRTFNVSFLTVLSCIAMIGATSIENRSSISGPPELESEPSDDSTDLPQCVALRQLMEVLT